MDAIKRKRFFGGLYRISFFLDKEPHFLDVNSNSQQVAKRAVRNLYKDKGYKFFCICKLKRVLKIFHPDRIINTHGLVNGYY